MSQPVVTSQPAPSAPLEEKGAMGAEPAPEKIMPSAPPLESIVLTQPMSSEVSEKLMYAQTEAMQVDEEEAKRRLQRNQDFCCFACADSCADDTWCWYIMCRMYCQCLGICCENCANCLDSCGEGCAECLQGCCEDDGCCSGSSGGGDISNDGDCDCDCDGCFD